MPAWVWLAMAVAAFAASAWIFVDTWRVGRRAMPSESEKAVSEAPRVFVSVSAEETRTVADALASERLDRPATTPDEPQYRKEAMLELIGSMAAFNATGAVNILSLVQTLGLLHGTHEPAKTTRGRH